MRILGNILSLDKHSVNLYGFMPDWLLAQRGECVKIVTNTGVIIYGYISGYILEHDEPRVLKNPKAGTIIALETALIVTKGKRIFKPRIYVGSRRIKEHQIMRVCDLNRYDMRKLTLDYFKYMSQNSLVIRYMTSEGVMYIPPQKLEINVDNPHAYNVEMISGRNNQKIEGIIYPYTLIRHLACSIESKRWKS